MKVNLYPPESVVDWVVHLTDIDCLGGLPEGVGAARYYKNKVIN